MKERLVERNKPITEPIKKNNFPTFNVLSKKVVSKDKAKVGVLKQDLALFSRLYISCQTRDLFIYLFIYLFIISHNKDYTSITLYKDVARGPQKTTRLVR